jgi:hypothetical protein
MQTYAEQELIDKTDRHLSSLAATYADVCRRTLTEVRILTYADVC